VLMLIVLTTVSVVTTVCRDSPVLLLCGELHVL
jgi:hypothetical protein